MTTCKVSHRSFTSHRGSKKLLVQRLHNAYHDSEWPKLDRFHCAVDHFDVMARGNLTTALRGEKVARGYAAALVAGVRLAALRGRRARCGSTASTASGVGSLSCCWMQNNALGDMATLLDRIESLTTSAQVDANLARLDRSLNEVL